jgi:hypothetical protein
MSDKSKPGSTAVFGAANPHCIGFDWPFNGHDCMIVIASTTHKDLHGMRMAKQVLDGFEQAVRQKYYPLQFNHDDDAPRLGVMVSAKVFTLPDGETALGAAIIKHSSPELAALYPAGAANTVFDKFLPAVDIQALLIGHQIKMMRYVEVKLTLEDQLEAFFQSHIVGPDGQIRTNKHLVTNIGSFQVVVWPEDHRPAHFHLISKPRNIDVSFTIHPVERLKDNIGKISNKQIKLVKLFFSTHPDELLKLHQAAVRLKLQN